MFSIFFVVFSFFFYILILVACMCVLCISPFLFFSSFILQSLEFVAETRILPEMKIENCGKKYFPWGKKSTSIVSFYEN